MHFGNNGFEERQLDQAYRVAYLVAGFIRNTLTEAERDELDDWICANEANEELFGELIDPDSISKALAERNNYNSAKAIEGIRKKIQFKTPAVKTANPFRWLAPLSAAAILLISLLFYWMWNKVDTRAPQKALSGSVSTILPGTTKATLSVAGGKSYQLDSSTQTLISDPNLVVEESAGQLNYKPATGPVQIHTVSVPRGGQFKLVLPDSSVVWLNAESSISYPSVMNDSQRVVEVTGELFFEVRKDPVRKFIVRSKHLTTEVLGTRFNVNLYEDNGSTAVYLQQGSVKVNTGLEKTSAHILKPGELLTNSYGQSTISNPDEEEVLAWKNGWFEFRNAGIRTIMDQVKRWYDVDIIYKGDITYHFDASIERNLPATRLLELLAMTGNVKFEYKDRTIIVTP